MSHLQYFAYKNVGEQHREKFRYSQAVRVGDRIECSGQGGWDPQTREFPKDIAAEIDRTFANVDYNLKDAGGEGWSQVFRVNSYHVVLNDEIMDIMVQKFKEYMPNHCPLWTCVGVPKLADPSMNVEIEVSAHVGK